MKKHFTSRNLIFALEIVVVFLVSFGFLPREAVLFVTGVMIFFVIFSPLDESLWLIVASIPLYVALPITEVFDSMSSWRIMILILFFALFFKKGISLSLIKDSRGKIRIYENLKHHVIEYSLLLFLAISVLSIFVADYKFLALKKLFFLVNIFALFLITRNLTRDKESILNIWRAAASGGAVVLAAAALQFLVVLFVPLYIFWQFWANNVIGAFYGSNLSNLLSYSNTWFAYYAVNPPTLRLFSVFPDSHSFAMFCILIIPVFLALAIFYKQERVKKTFYWLMSAAALSGIVLSGSRGSWLSFIPVFGAAFYIYIKKLEPTLSKKAFLSISIFVFLFVASVGYPSLFYKFQSWQTNQNASTTFSFFERVKSISDSEETSNKGRLEIWRASLGSILKRPFLGVGLGNYVKVLDENISSAKKGASAHNLYLDFASEIGIFGALAAIVMFLDIFYTSWRVFRRAPEKHFKFYGLLVCLYFLWVAGYSFFDVVLLNDKVLLLCVVVLATLYSLRNIYFNPEKI